MRKLKHVAEIARSVAEIAALVLLFVHLYEPLAVGHEVQYWAFLITVVIFFLAGAISIVLSWKKEKLARNARFSDALRYINTAFTQIHVTIGKKPESPEAYLSAFKSFCNGLSQAFSLISGTQCHVCIKIHSGKIGDDGQIKYFAKAIAREEFIIPRHPGSPSRKSHDEGNLHFYDDNTDFNTILSNIKTYKARYFYEDDLTTLAGYKNSSFLSFDLPIEGPGKKKKWWHRKPKWPLPYKTAIVAAICPSITEHNANDPIAGFLCVDSEEPFCFKEETDTHLLIGCANGLFNIIEEYKQAVKNQAIKNAAAKAAGGR
jgi:hypothetical protein